MAIPTLVQSVMTGQDTSGTTGPSTTLQITFPNASLANNLLVVAFQYGANDATQADITSVKDSSGIQWTLGPSFANSTTVDSAVCYYRADAPAGITGVTVTFNVTFAFVQGHFSEWYNISTSTPVDGSVGTASATTSPYKAGSFTPGTSGDLILCWGFGFGGGTGTLSGFTAGVAGSGFTLLGADIQSGGSSGTPAGTGAIAEYQIQASAAAIQSDFTTSGNTTATYGLLSIAFKSAAAGTAPPSTGIRIKFVHHQYLGTSPSTHLQFPTDSNCNLLVGMYNDDNSFITGLTDSKSNAWSFPSSTKADNSANATTAQIIYSAAAVGDPTLGSMTYSFNTTPAGNPMIVLFGITGAATSPFDVGAVATGNNSSTQITTTVSIRPTKAGGLVFWNMAVTWNDVQSVSAVGQSPIFDSVLDATLDNNTGFTSPSSLDEDNGNGHVYVTDPSTMTFVAKTNGPVSPNPGPGQWASAAASFFAPTVSNPPGSKTSRAQQIEASYW